MKAREALQELASNLDEINHEDIPLEDLLKAAVYVKQALDNAASSSIQDDEMGEGQDDKTTTIDKFTLQELESLAELFSKIQDQRKLNSSQLNFEITKRLQKRDELRLARLREDNDAIESLSEEIDQLDSSISAREKIDRTLNGVNRSQIARIKQTIYRMLEKDVTLGEQIKTLFKEQLPSVEGGIASAGIATSNRTRLVYQ